MNIFELLVVQPLFNLLMLLYAVIPGGDFGLTIIIFTILMRLAIHPLVRKQLHQTKAMRKMQPELEEIKRQTKGNKQLQSIQMMELYKKHGVSPFRSIGILLIQLPIFLSLYIVIQVFTLHANELAKWTYDFLQNIGPIKTIIENPSSLNLDLFGLVDLTKHAFANGNVSWVLVVLAVVAAVGQFFQSKQTMPQSNNRKIRDILKEAAEGKEADQAEVYSAIMAKMIYVFTFFMLFIMLSLPGAIALYYAVQTIVAVIQQHFILREDEEELEEIASEHPAQSSTKSNAKARAKAAKEANVTRIVAKGSRPSKAKKYKGGK